MAKCSPAHPGHVIPSAVTSPHDQRAHGLPQDLKRSDEWSADPPAATRTEPAKAARQKPLDERVSSETISCVDRAHYEEIAGVLRGLLVRLDDRLPGKDVT